MGLDAGDYDGSGRPALWATNYEHELHGLYRNDSPLTLPSPPGGEGRVRGSVMFHYQTVEAGLAERGQRYVGWGTAFLDVNLDGWEDLFVANGHVVHHHPGKAVGRKQPPVMTWSGRGLSCRWVSAP
jgi:hypothetical protein